MQTIFKVISFYSHTTTTTTTKTKPQPKLVGLYWSILHHSSLSYCLLFILNSIIYLSWFNFLKRDRYLFMLFFFFIRDVNAHWVTLWMVTLKVIVHMLFKSQSWQDRRTYLHLWNLRCIYMTDNEIWRVFGKSLSWHCSLHIRGCSTGHFTFVDSLSTPPIFRFLQDLISNCGHYLASTYHAIRFRLAWTNLGIRPRDILVLARIEIT
jgi:hypothetical protein